MITTGKARLIVEPIYYFVGKVERFMTYEIPFLHFPVYRTQKPASSSLSYGASAFFFYRPSNWSSPLLPCDIFLSLCSPAIAYWIRLYAGPFLHRVFPYFVFNLIYFKLWRFMRREVSSFCVKMPVRRGHVALQNTYLDTIIRKFDGQSKWTHFTLWLKK